MKSKTSHDNIVDSKPTEVTFDDFVLKTKFKSRIAQVQIFKIQRC